MKVHKAEIGERYADNSGWERRLMIDLQSGKAEIELDGSILIIHPRELLWVREAIDHALNATIDK